MNTKSQCVIGNGEKCAHFSKKNWKNHSQFEQRSKFRPFRKQILSATHDRYKILGVFTAELTFQTGVKAHAYFLLTPNTDVPLTLGTQVMEENNLSIEFHWKQLMMEKEGKVVNLQLVYKADLPSNVNPCETEADTCLESWSLGKNGKNPTRGKSRNKCNEWGGRKNLFVSSNTR